jgi:hypothetical protein
LTILHRDARSFQSVGQWDSSKPALQLARDIRDSIPTDGDIGTNGRSEGSLPLTLPLSLSTATELIPAETASQPTKPSDAAEAASA